MEIHPSPQRSLPCALPHLLVLLATSLLFLCLDEAHAVKEFTEFRRVGKTDWKVMPPESLGPTSGLILHRKIILQDYKTETEFRATLSVYWRVRLFDQDGVDKMRKMEIPYGNGWHLDRLEARTVKANGKAIEVPQDDIHDKILLRFGGYQLNAKSFAFKDLEAGDIVEYFCTMDMPLLEVPMLHLRQAYPTRRFEFSWHRLPIVRFQGIEKVTYARFAREPTWTLTTPPACRPDICHVPNEKDAELTTVKIRDLPALPEYSFSVSEHDLEYCFYRDYQYPGRDRRESFWRRVAQSYGEQRWSFLSKNGQPCSLPYDLESSGDCLADIDTVLALVHRSVRLAVPDDPTNDHLTDVISHGTGSAHDLNSLFLAGIRQLGYEATGFWIKDRTEGPFLVDWQNPAQFTLSGIAVRAGDRLQWCFPAIPGGSSRSYPWEAIGCKALLERPRTSGIEDDESDVFPTLAELPIVRAGMNEIELRAYLSLTESEDLLGEMNVHWRCPNDQSFLYRVREQGSTKSLEELRSTALQSGLAWEAANERYHTEEDTVVYSCSLRVQNAVERAGARILIFLSKLRMDDWNLPAELEDQDLECKYPMTVRSVITMDVPDGYLVESERSEEHCGGGPLSYYSHWQLSPLYIRQTRKLILSQTTISRAMVGAMLQCLEEVHAHDLDPIVLRESGDVPRPSN